jgi:hypothetical protein
MESMGLESDLRNLFVADRHAVRVTPAVEFGADAESCFAAGG